MVKNGTHIGIVGCQWGDEGKGKIVDFLTNAALRKIHQECYGDLSLNSALAEMQILRQKFILTERYQGGKNAGHSLVINGKRMSLHQIPSGIMTPGTYNLMGHGVFFEPRAALKELTGLRERGVDIHPGMFGISSQAHITFDFHIDADQAAFNKDKWTSTGSGVKQTAVDKAGRVGIRFGEFLDRRVFTQILHSRFPKGIPGYGSVDNFVASYDQERSALARYLVSEYDVKKDHGLFYHFSEGAQGVMLGLDQGDYPGVTSSNPAMVPGRPDLLLGVYKLYCSSVGTGGRAFISRMPVDLESKLHQPWREFGTTTGKLREIGWFDAVQAKYAAQVAGIDYAAITCGDRMELLHSMGVKPQIVVGYKIGRKEYREWDPIFDRRGVREMAEPIFDRRFDGGFPAWKKFMRNDGETMTSAAARYVDRIQELTNIEVAMISTGAGREDIVLRKDLLNFNSYEHPFTHPRNIGEPLNNNDAFKGKGQENQYRR